MPGTPIAYCPISLRDARYSIAYRPMRCPVPAYRRRGTEVAYAPTRRGVRGTRWDREASTSQVIPAICLRLPYPESGTGLAYAAGGVMHAVRSTLSGTELAYGASAPVQSWSGSELVYGAGC
eukprot:3239419-Rhodomonas_salina.1